MLWDSYNNIPTSLPNGINLSKEILGRMHTSEPPANISRMQYLELVFKGQLKRTTSDGLPIDEVIAIYHTSLNGWMRIEKSEVLLLNTMYQSNYICEP